MKTITLKKFVTETNIPGAWHSFNIEPECPLKRGIFFNLQPALAAVVAGVPKYAATPHKTIENICQLARDRVVAGESPRKVAVDLIEGFGLGYGSANAVQVQRATEKPAIATVKPVCSDLSEGEATAGTWSAGVFFEDRNDAHQDNRRWFVQSDCNKSRPVVVECVSWYSRPGEMEANARLIARAVNSHAELDRRVAAYEEIVRELGEPTLRMGIAKLKSRNAGLVAALKRCVNHLIMDGTHCNDAPEALAQARAAIASAKGGGF